MWKRSEGRLLTTSAVPITARLSSLKKTFTLLPGGGGSGSSGVPCASYPTKCGRYDQCYTECGTQ